MNRDKPMVIDAQSLQDFQSCHRRHRIAQDWMPRRWYPKSLFVHCLRHALLDLCNGKSPEEAANEHKTRLLELAADPGMDTIGSNPYTLAKDYCAMIDTIVRSEFRSLQPEIPKLEELPDIALMDGHSWKFSARKGTDGNLHRWVFWDSFSDERLTKELHGWHCFGDMALAKMPMLLHIVIIGRLHGGRPQSPWARGWRSDFMRKKIRFKKRDSSAFNAKFKKVYFADIPQQNPDEWVDCMWADDEAQSLIHKIRVKLPPDKVLADTKRQIVVESFNMSDLRTAHHLIPMSRGACDGWIPCPFQHVCFREDAGGSIEGLGIYKRKEKPQ